MSERDYWREPPPRGGGFAGGPQLALPSMTPVVKRLLVANAAVFGALFLVLMVAGRAAAGEVQSWFALDAAAWRAGFPLVPVWQLATYGFLHSLESPGHILWNMLLLYFMGTMLEGMLGGRRFLVLYLACLLSGGLLQIAIDLLGGWSPLVLGASGAVLGVVVAMAVLRPQTQVLVLFIPVTLKWLAIIIVGIDMFMALSMTRSGTTTGTAHWVHLGGAAWGGLAAWRGWIWRDPIQNFRAQRKVAERERVQRDEERVDELLQKIHREGIHSLSRRERDFLKKVSERR